MSTMQAIHVADPSAGVVGLDLTSLPVPTISSPYDILVKVQAVALNPVDTKKREGLGGSSKGVVLGYDGAGVVVDAGPVARFVKGDSVLYSGDLTRPGSNAQFQLVDSRVAGRKAEGLAWVDAAALPLVGLTAWEMFQDKFRLVPGDDNAQEVLIVVNGAGGVGSMAIQLAKKVFGIRRVIATASRPETIEWVKKMGATDVINHRNDLGPQLKELGIAPTLAFITYDTPRYVKELAGVMQACGQMGSIVEDDNPIPVHDVDVFMKALSFHWEFMFAKTMHKHQEDTQGKIVEHLAKLAADGTLLSTITSQDELSVSALRKGHELQESGKAMGKITFSVPDTLT